MLDYNAQYKNVEKIIKQHWHILLTDTHLKSLLPQIPNFVYKRAPTLRDKIVKNIPDPPSIGYTFFTGKGFYPCKYCFACTKTKRPWEKNFKFTSTSTGNTYEISDFICCNTEGAVYALECSCGLQYIGSTKRPLKVCIKEHVQNIIKGFEKKIVFINTLPQITNKTPPIWNFGASSLTKKHYVCGHKVRILSQLESKWIFILDTFTPGV